MKDKNKDSFFVFMISFSILTFELLFIRVLALQEWQTYTSMVISVALLGFGFSGTIISIFEKFIIKYFSIVRSFSTIFYVILLILGFILYSIIPFNPFELVWVRIQILFLFLHLFVILLPFILGAFIIGIHFIGKSSVTTIYFSNLFGSGFGVIFVLFILHIFNPINSLLLVLLICSILFITMAIMEIKKVTKKVLMYFIVSIIVLISLFVLFVKYHDSIKMSEYKGLSYALKMPNSRVIIEKHSPLGVVQLVEADGLRMVNGLSHNYKGYIPVHKALFFDGDSGSPVIPFDGDQSKLEYLKYSSQALPYFINKNNDNIKGLVIGVGGGEGVLRNIVFGTEKITGVEINKNVIDIMKNEMLDFSGKIYERNNVEIINKEARGFIRKNKEKFDIIEISTLDSFNAAMSGVYSINADFIYTVESFSELYDTLTNRGVLAITRWLKDPPRDNLKLFSLAVEMLRKNKINDLEKKLAFIRSSNTATLCIFKDQVKSEVIRKFCSLYSFDIIFLADINKDEVNKNIILPEPLYYNSSIALVSEDSKEFLDKYPFFIYPPVDDSPYFNNFFKLRSIKLISKKGSKQIPFSEWGYFIFIILLIPISLISFLMIIFPLFIKNNLNLVKENMFNKSSVYLYFFIIAFAFFFIEMPLIQKFSHFLANPIYSLSITIATILIFAGIGCFFLGKINNLMYVFISLIIILGLYILFLDKIFLLFIGQNMAAKIIISIILLGIPGFFMGMPFSAGLAKIKKENISLVPWAWGINGFASVISALLGTLLAILIGFTKVLTISLLLYFFAGLLFRNLYRKQK